MVQHRGRPLGAHVARIDGSRDTPDSGSRHHFGNYVSEGKRVSDRIVSSVPVVIELVR